MSQQTSHRLSRTGLVSLNSVSVTGSQVALPEDGRKAYTCRGGEWRRCCGHQKSYKSSHHSLLRCVKQGTSEKSPRGQKRNLRTLLHHDICKTVIWKLLFVHSFGEQLCLHMENKTARRDGSRFFGQGWGDAHQQCPRSSALLGWLVTDTKSSE